MLEGKKRKIWGTKYSLAGRIDPNTGQMELSLFFNDKQENTISIQGQKEVRKRLEQLLYEHSSYLDTENILDDFGPFLRHELTRLQENREKHLYETQPQITEFSAQLLQPLIKRIEQIETELNQIRKRLSQLEDRPFSAGDPGSAPERPLIGYQFEKIELLRSQGKNQEYIESLEEMLSKDPSSLVIQNMLGNAYLKGQKWIKAKGAFDLILQKDPQNFNSLLGLAMVYHFTRRSQLAVDILEQAQKISPTSKKVNKLLTAVRQALGIPVVTSIEEQSSVHEESDTKYPSHDGEETEKLDPPLVDEGSSPGIESGAPTPALDAKHQEHAEISSERPPTRKQKDSDDINKFYDEFMERGKQYYRSRKLEEALQMFSEAARLKPDTLKSWHNLGVVAESIARRTQAHEAFTRALAICVSNEDLEGQKKYQEWLAKL